MLSHRNILSNAYASLQIMTVGRDDVFLSFLPLSHMFERACGYYLTIMSGSTTVFARSVQQLSEDLQTMHPTLLISVPRIYERIYAAIKAKLDEGSALKKALFCLTVDIGNLRFEYLQGRRGWSPSLLLWPLLDALVAKKILARLGGNLRAALSGGAALPPDVARVFIGLGLNLLQGYGMTETSPVACANHPDDNIPASVGTPAPGVEIRIGEHSALLIKGPNVMLGYWKNDYRGATTYAIKKMIADRDITVTHLMFNFMQMVAGQEIQFTNNKDKSRTFGAAYMHANRLFIAESTVPKGMPPPTVLQQTFGWLDETGTKNVRYAYLYTNEPDHAVAPPPVRGQAGQ